MASPFTIIINQRLDFYDLRISGHHINILKSMCSCVRLLYMFTKNILKRKGGSFRYIHHFQPQ